MANDCAVVEINSLFSLNYGYELGFRRKKKRNMRSEVDPPTFFQ